MELKEGASSASLVSRSTVDISITRRVCWLLDLIYNQVLAVITFVLLWTLCANNEVSFSNKRFVHYFFTTAAYVPLMAAAIILFSENNLATLYIKRTNKYWIHGALLLLSCVLVTVGIAVEIADKDKRNRPHFKSNHAILGLVSWILVMVAVIIGIAAANTRIFSVFVRPIVVKFVHNFLGIAGFVIGMISLYLKLNFLKFNCSENVFVASKWAIIYITTWSCLAALKSLWGQLRGILC